MRVKIYKDDGEITLAGVLLLLLVGIPAFVGTLAALSYYGLLFFPDMP